MNKTLISLTLCVAGSAWAQVTPVGVWHSIDDKTGETKAEIRLTETDGIVNGRIERLLRQGADLAARCHECEGDRKNQLVIGLEIVRGARKAQGKDVWEGGKILDPESGRDYTLRMTPIEGGRKLEVRGSIAFIGRTQTWVRVQ